MTAAKVRVVTQNIKNFPEPDTKGGIPHGEIAGVVANAAKRADVVGWQEMGSKWHKAALDGLDGWTTCWGKGRKVCDDPVSWRTDLFDLVESGYFLLHEGKAEICANRWATWVLLRHKATGLEFVVCNKHYVPAVFNGKDDGSEALRWSMWQSGLTKETKHVTHWVTKGLPVVSTGDYNKQLRPQQTFDKKHTIGAPFSNVAGHQVTYHVVDTSIDHIWTVDGSAARWSEVRRNTFSGAPSDHNGRLAVLTLSPVTAAVPAPAPSTPKGSTVTTTKTTTPAAVKGVADLTKWFKAQQGYQEGRKNGHWDNIEKYAAMANLSQYNGQAWCATFVIAGFVQAGLGALIPVHSPGCDQLAKGFKDKGRWSEYPALGAIIFYGTATDLVHTGYVYAYDNLYVYTVEGNTNTSGSPEGDGVYLKKHLRTDSYVVGYGYPAYAAGIQSADPAWQNGKKSSAPVTAPTSPAYPPNRTLDLVDLSHFQGKADLQSAANAGVKGIYNKSTQGCGYVDPSYTSRRKVAKQASKARKAAGKAGLLFGAYHFADPTKTDARAEAAHFLSIANPQPGDLIPVLDLEKSNGMDKTALTVWVGEFVDAVQAKTGVKPMIYTPFDLAKGYGCYLWVARYSNTFEAPRIPAPWTKAVMWQHSDGQYGPIKTVPGIGACDVDALHPDVPLSALTIPAPKVATPAPAPVAAAAPVSAPKTAAPSRVTQARTLLVEAEAAATKARHTNRASAIKKALAVLPKK